MGLQSGDTTDGPLCFDSVAPKITSAPTVNLLGQTGLVHGTAPVNVRWIGSDATSGINHYTLYQSKDGGTFTQVGTSTGELKVVDLAPGHTYQFKVTATDNAGNISAGKSGKTYTLSLYQENSTKIKYSTGWKRQTLTGASGGQVEYATAKGKTATLTFTGIQAEWVSTLGPTRGSATAKLDSGAVATVDTHASTPKTAQIVKVLKGTSGSHKFVVTVLGTSGHPRVDIDAFIVLAG
jgi:hypothetical protein